MIGDLRPYPKMKDSATPWLGEVPAHWQVLPNRAIFTEVKDRGYPDEEMLSVTITKGVVRQRSLLEDSSKKDGSNLDKSAYKLVCPGDIAYNKMRAWQGAVGVSEFRGIVSPAYVVQRPRESVNSRYAHYLLRTPGLAKEAERWSYGITSDMWSLRPEHFKVIYSCLPPLSEQAAIVQFLDHADRRIRWYIRAKQKLVKLLEEQKQAIIHRAVTRGLDPNVRLKPSGVEWLGEVPEHWDVSQVRAVARVVRGSSPRPAGSTLYFHGTDAPWITVGEVTRAPGIYVTETATRLTKSGANLSRIIEPGTLLLTNSGATLGVPKISQIRGCINDGVAAFLGLRPRMRTEYLLHYLTTQTVHLKAWVDLGAQPNLNTQIIGSWPITIPPVEEQDEIALHISRQTRALSEAVRRAREGVELVGEYGRCLIADVVTGKLDVREATSRLAGVNERELIDGADSAGDASETTTDDIDVIAQEAGT